MTDIDDLTTRLRDAYAREGLARLASIISHDLNNLVLVVQGYAELLLMKSDDAARRQTQLEQIRSASIAAGRLSTQLHAFSRLGEQPPVVVDVNLIVRALRAVAGAPLQSRATVELSLTEEPALAKYAVAPLIEQLAVALATAITTAQEGGRVLIETSIEDDQFVVVHVSLPGQGMTAGSTTGNLTDGSTAVRLPIERPRAQESR